MRRRILIVNDDGLFGAGLRPLITSMRKVGLVTVVVPDHERSADSHSLTLHKPLRVRKISENFYILNGSPADCARFGILGILKDKVDLVVSGINQGFNLGEDVVYSGTVAGALEATLLGKPSFAISQGIGSQKVDYKLAAAFARRVAARIFKHGLAEGVCLNVNVPDSVHPGPAAITRLGRRVYGKKITGRLDPRGHRYFWLAGKNVTGIGVPGTDVAAAEAGRLSITPLHIDNTDLPTLQSLRRWDL